MRGQGSASAEITGRPGVRAADRPPAPAGRQPNRCIGFGRGGEMTSAQVVVLRRRRRRRALGAAQGRARADEAAGGRRRDRGGVPDRLAGRQGPVAGRPMDRPALAHQPGHRRGRWPGGTGSGWLSLVVTVVSSRSGCWGGDGGCGSRSRRGPAGMLRAWWQRWIVYAPRMPGWLRACGLTVADRGPGDHRAGQPVPAHRRAAQAPPPPRPAAPHRQGACPAARGTRCASGSCPGRRRRTSTRPPAPWPSPAGWPAARSASWARTLVSIDYQRRDLLADLVPCPTSPTLAAVRGEDGGPAAGVVRAHRVRHRLAPAPGRAGTP